MEQTLLSRESLANRWEVSVKTIQRYEEDGIITRVKNIPVPRYPISQILKLEEIDISETSPLFVKQLKKENNQLKEENEKLNQKLNLVRQALI